MTNGWPKTVNVLGTPYEIVYVTRPEDVDRDERRTDLLGQTNHIRRCITILTSGEGVDKTSDDVFQILVHEIFHVILSQCMLLEDSIAKKVSEESFVDTLTKIFADTLVRNRLIELPPVPKES